MEQSTDAVIALAAAVREQANAFLLRALAERGVTDLLPAHGAVLHALFRQGPLSMGALAEAIDRRILKELRMNGLVNSELEVISHLDHEIETESDVIPVAMKNGLIQEAKSSVAGGNRFSALKRYVNEKLKTEGREILEGAVAVNPYKQGNKTACDYCPYHAVCGFDLKTSGFGFRKFKPLKSEEIWPEIEGEQQDGD